MEYLPGNTILSPIEYSLVSLTPLKENHDRPMIIFASNDVNDETLFLNGLTQNIVVLYDLFESLGYKCYLLQNHPNATSEKKNFILTYRAISTQDIVRELMPIKALIEIGMSVDAMTRSYLRSIGAKIVKLYLGNILNIDIESIQNYSNMFFNHHIVGELDQIWTSPHYEQHIEYAAILNRTSVENSRIVPYVWDPCFVTHYGTKEELEWIPPNDWTQMDMVVMEPNISFQKYAFYTLLLIEAFSKAHPEWKGKVHVINGDRMKITANAMNNVLSNLTMYQTDRIVLHPRKKIHTILKENRSACFLTHQWNNDYNYMTLELLYCNYPILHNSEGWFNFGYYYSINEWEKAINTLYIALKEHKNNMPIYKSHAANLIWNHSIHNPSIQSRWKDLLKF